MKLAVTGGAGFLGYHLCRGLSAKFDQIIVLDIAPIDPTEYPQNVRYFNVDVRDLDALNKIFADVDLVVHGAAALPLWKPKEVYDINIQGTKNVLEAAINNQVERVVNVSSTAVYGMPEKHPLYEDDPLVGIGPYGESKIEAENICEQYRRKGFCVPNLRPKTFIGYGRLGIFQILYDWVKSGKRIPIIGKGKNRYQLLEVEDLVDVTYLTLTAPSDQVNDTYNVGAKEFGTVLEDVGALCEFAGSGARVMPTPAWIVKPTLAVFEKLKLSPLYKWVYGTADKESLVSIEKIENALGWTPKYSNSQTLIRSYQWYLEHCHEIQKEGITHKVAWKQGILGVFKRWL